MIKGVTVRLMEKIQTGTDAMNAPIYEERPVDVENVLVGEPTRDEVLSSTQLYGKKVAYTLAIPKGDPHDWSDAVIELPAPFAGRYRTIGYPTAGIEANIPLLWNRKVSIERYG